MRFYSKIPEKSGFISYLEYRIYTYKLFLIVYYITYINVFA
jgi:hypothetical protein